jgi:hypothetical protein
MLPWCYLPATLSASSDAYMVRMLWARVDTCATISERSISMIRRAGVPAAVELLGEAGLSICRGDG